MIGQQIDQLAYLTAEALASSGACPRANVIEMLCVLGLSDEEAAEVITYALSHLFLEEDGTALRSTFKAARAPKTEWSTLAVRLEGSSDLVVGDERNALLVRWLRGEELPEVSFVDPTTGCAVDNPMSVSWSYFPLQDALEAAWVTVPMVSEVRLRRGAS